MRHPLTILSLLGLLTAPAVTGCARGARPEMPAAARFTAEVESILAARHPTPAHFEALSQLEEMGPEVDAVLVGLAVDPEIGAEARANALLLLAKRRSSAALPTLRRILLTEERPALRAAAVLALQRLGTDSDAVANLIRSAVGDPARAVRLNALQALDIRDVGAIRSALEHETDREVRQVAMQLLSLAEARGAPLGADRRGALRTTGAEGDPQIVFRPARVDSLARVAVGDARVELPEGTDVPLSATAEVVARVVPAFFSPDRSRVVFEAEREIRVVDLASREVHSLGPGIAPRPIPFTHQFVFVRERADGRRDAERGTEIRYAVYRAAFAGGAPERVGELSAVARMDRHANYSPVRWMVVAETPEGFVLRGEGLETFLLPTPVWQNSVPDSSTHGSPEARP